MQIFITVLQNYESEVKQEFFILDLALKCWLKKSSRNEIWGFFCLFLKSWDSSRTVKQQMGGGEAVAEMFKALLLWNKKNWPQVWRNICI